MDEFVPRIDPHGQIRTTIPDGKPRPIVHAACKPLIPAPSANSFLNELRTRLPGSGLRNAQQSGNP
jgi:hypothetical protein